MIDSNVRRESIKFAKFAIIATLIALAYLNISFLSTKRLDFEIVFFIAGYLLILLFYFYKERENIISIKTIFLGLYTLMLGASPVISYYDNNKSLMSNVGNPLNYQLGYIMLGLVAMVLGFYAFSFKRYDASKVSKVNLISIKRFALILLCASMFFNVYDFIINSGIYFGGNLVGDKMGSRAGAGVIGIIISFYLLGIGLLYYYVLETKKCRLTLLIFLVFNAITILLKGSRTGVLSLIIILILIRNGKKRFKPTSLLKLFGVLVLMIAVLGLIKDSFSSYNSTFDRLLIDNLKVNSINLNYVHNAFPRHCEFQKGSYYFINIKMLMPGPDVDSTLWLKDVIGLKFVGGGVTPTLIGEGYLNFGLAGIVLEGFVAGVIASILDKRYIYRTEGFVFICYFVTKLTDIFRGGFSNSEVSVIVGIVLLYIYKVFRRLRISNT